MAKSDPYFQFPLSMLAYAAKPQDRLSAIIDFCCVQVGTRIYDQIEAGETGDDVDSRIARFSAESLPKGFNGEDEHHVRLVLGMQALNVAHGIADTILATARKAIQFNSAMAGCFGAYPLVRLRAGLLWDAYKESGLTYRDFAVLCAVFSVIGGNDGPVRIHREWIIARSMGYKRAKDMTASELKLRADKAQPITIDQLRYTLDRLEARSLFARVQVNRRLTVFSHRMTRKELSEAAVQRFGRPNVLRVNRQNDRDVQERIKRARASYHSGGKSTAAAESPQHPQTGTTTPPATFPTQFPTINRSSLIEAVSIEAGLIETPHRHLAVQGVSSGNDSETTRLVTLIRQAKEIGTPEALRQAEAYRVQLAQLTEIVTP